MFFKSIKEINRLMTYPKFWFSKFKKFVSSGQSLGGKFASSGQSLGSYNSRRYRWILRNYDVLKRKILEFCWDNKIKKKTKWNWRCTVYWIHFQNIPTFTCQKTLLNTFFCLFLKSSKAFSVSLIQGS